MKRLFAGLVLLAVLGAALYAGLVWFLTKPAPPLAQSAVVISVDQGEVRAGIDAQNETVLVFNGLPFAAPPVGDLRWRPPQAAPTWTEIRDGRDFGPECLQYRAGSEEFLNDLVAGLGLNWTTRQLAAISFAHARPPVESEDCLYLNIRTPNVDGETPLPVMVWIHGGSHQSGAGSMDIYQANGLVEQGVVLVTINYRLGPLGYLAHPALSADDARGVSGNYGLLDQIAALDWVRGNIAAFGGDPDNVTIFGESAGAQSVSEIMASPMANGLYHKAILQSGVSSYNGNGLTYALEGRLTSEAAGAVFLDSLAGEGADAAALRALPGEAVIAQVAQHEELRDYFLPTVDGVVLPRLIGDTIIAGDMPTIPVLAGYNADEATLFYDSIQAPTALEAPFPEAHAERLAMLDTLYGDRDAAILRAAYGLDAAEDWESGAIDMLGDDLFGVHTRLFGRKNAESGAPTWLYHFTRVPPSPTQTLGAFHASEIFFVFDSHSPLMEVTPDDRILTDTMAAYWTNFAKTGDPNGSGLPVWPAYDEADTWLILDAEIRREVQLRAAKLDVMERQLAAQVEAAIGVISPWSPAAQTALASMSEGEEIAADSFEP